MEEERIVSKVGIHGGVPCFKGTRIPLWSALEALMEGESFEFILHQFPKLSRKDIRAMLAYCSKLVGR